MDEIYVTDAYHSPPIEGYQVSPELIEKVRSEVGNPDDDNEDRAMKMRLPHAAGKHFSVRESVVLEGADVERSRSVI
jgi:hypothetical protein